LDRALLLKRGKRAERSDHDLLHYVLRVVVISHESTRNAVHKPLMLPHKGIAGVLTISRSICFKYLEV
jgi:hypothetical protein